MKKQYSFRFLFLLFLAVLFLAMDTVYSQDRNTLLITNPTVGNIWGIVRLIDEGIFPLKDFKLKGVYYSKENYDYSETEKYIKDNNLDIRLEMVDVDLDANNLFSRNACSTVFEKLFNESSGVIFNGGPDIPPAIYGEKTSTLTVISDPYRHYFEASFLFNLLGGFQDLNFTPLLEKNKSYLVVGFCLGMQTMNVATGGTLVQDIPLEIYNMQNAEDILNLAPDQQHRNYEADIDDSPWLFRGNIHPVKINENSWIITEGLVKPGQYPAVISSHHQAVEKTGKNLKVEATSMDGKVIEAVSHSNYPNVLGFQFHPEIPDIYNYENTYQFHPNEERESLRKLIEKGNGYEFHIALWSKFAGILNSK